jgi:hypothetical protein
MKNLLAAAILLMYTVSSGGFVLIEFSCHETGTRGVTTPAPRSCYAPECGDEAPAEPDPCCDHACCEIDVRVSSTDEQITGGSNGPGDASPAGTGAEATSLLSDAGTADATATGALPTAFAGHIRPIRI